MTLAVQQSEPAREGIAERRAVAVIGAYVAAIVIAEVLVAFVSPLAGTLVDAVVLLTIINHYLSLAPPRQPEDGPSRSPGIEGDALPALALVPLLRLASLSLPLSEISRVYWLAAAGAPVLLAAVLLARSTPRVAHSAPPLFARDRPGRQALFALIGIPLGLIAYLLLDPEPLTSTSSWPRLVAASVSVFVFGGVLEEVVFRGLLQRALVRAWGRRGLILSCVLFAAVYLGTDSILAVTFFALVGVLFALWVERSASLVGVVVAHGLLTLGLLVVWPLVLG